MNNNNNNTVLPFQLDTPSIRGRMTRLSTAVNDILSAHNYPDQVAVLVAEMVTICTLVGQMIKLRYRLSVQVRAHAENAAPVSLIFADYIAPQEEGDLPSIRAYAVYDTVRVVDKTHTTPFDLLDPKGTFAISVDQGPDMKPYQGMTPVAGESLSDCMQVYFAQSEQVATSALVRTHKDDQGMWQSGGIMVQHMPNHHKNDMESTYDDGERTQSITHADGLLRARDIARMSGYEEDWQRANILLNTAHATEIIGNDNVRMDVVLHRLFHEEDLKLYTPESITFGCSCSREKVEGALQLSSSEDLLAMQVNDEGKIQAQCQFCSKEYFFEMAELVST